MISLIILTGLFLFILSNNFKSVHKNEELFISNLITALILSISLIGLISISLIFLSSTKLPIILIIFSLTLIYSYFYKINYQNILNFKNSSKLIYEIFSKNFLNSFYIVFLMIWLLFISFGPLNHPDVTTTYVGYPYQFFFQNRHFIDGGLHQGLLGICDFANLSFFQENNTWLIRSAQAIPIALIVPIFLLRKTNKLLVIAFLTCPVFIQWITIGKYLFLPDISITITYIVWNKFKDKNSLFNLIIVILLSLSFKISCLIISIPIALHLIFELSKNKDYLVNDFKVNSLRIYLIVFSLLALTSILIYRFNITGNLFYPIFNSHFVSNNQQMVDFEIYLRGFMRNYGFPFNLIMTNNSKFLGLIIGPATGLFLISIPLVNMIIIRKKFISSYEFVAIGQLILLLTISQGRADYFLSPIIIMFMSENVYKYKLFSLPKSLFSKNFIFKLTTLSLLLIQIFIFSSITLISGYQTIFSIINYDSSMKKYAYNYELTNILNNFSDEPIMNLGNRTTLLFLKKNYIHEDKFKKCIDSDLNKNDRLSRCISTLNANSVIIYGDKLEINKEFKCVEYIANSTSRNPLNSKKQIFHICNKTKS